MAQNFAVAGAASFPLEDGGAVAPVDLTSQVPYTSRADFVRNYVAAIVDDPVDFGTLDVPGAKGILVKCKTGSCVIKFQTTGGNPWPLSPGGEFLWTNPSQAFPTAAFITTTGAASVVFIAVG